MTPAYAPWNRGFDTAVGFFASGVDYYTRCSYKAPPPTDTHDLRWCRLVNGRYLFDWFEVLGDATTNSIRSTPSYISPGHPRYTNATYLTTVHAQRARQVILDHNSTRGPLFLFLSFAAVHAPLQATPDLLARVDAIRGGADYFQRCSWFDWGDGVANPTPYNPESPLPFVETSSAISTCIGADRRLLEAMALGIDDTVASLEGALRGRGMWDETLVVFVSDNGGAINQQGSNKPLRGGKKGYFEGGVRVPGAVSGGYLPLQLRGTSSAALTHVADWWSTLTHAAGIDSGDHRSAGQSVATVDGQSMWSTWLLAASQPPLRTIIVDGSVALRSDGAGRVFKLSTSDMDLCTTRVYWSREACGPLPLGRTFVSNETHVGGWGEACTPEAPCLYDVLADPREEARLDMTAHRELVQSMTVAMSDSLVSVVDPFYPSEITCPDNTMYAANGYVRRPSLVHDVSIPPRPPLPPPASRPHALVGANASLERSLPTPTPTPLHPPPPALPLHPLPPAPPPQPAPPIASMQSVDRLEARLSSTYSNTPGYGAGMCIDNDVQTLCGTDSEASAWLSVRVSEGTRVGYVIVYNRVDAPTLQHWLSPFEVFVGSSFGDAAVRCGPPIEVPTGPGPFAVWCGDASDSGGRSLSYVTIRHVGPARHLAVAELVIYRMPLPSPPPPPLPPREPPSPPLSPPPVPPLPLPPLLPPPCAPPPRPPPPYHPPPTSPPPQRPAPCPPPPYLPPPRLPPLLPPPPSPPTVCSGAVPVDGTAVECAACLGGSAYCPQCA